ncbi:hypothetical protein GH714_022760 [Hevea brasiliensis]|uniref:Myb-like domain-containing protein n=1 Tax=Hevea brasiliensis TaxID=3981 RepID=A0A6A6NIU5_HEVBR|nr:hypothetical protein GH714_022760 [Hevea brasiliensis]
MGRAPCCEKVGLKKGRWTAEEDEKLVNYFKLMGRLMETPVLVKETLSVASEDTAILDPRVEDEEKVQMDLVIPSPCQERAEGEGEGLVLHLSEEEQSEMLGPYHGFAGKMLLFDDNIQDELLDAEQEDDVSLTSLEGEKKSTVRSEDQREKENGKLSSNDDLYVCSSTAYSFDEWSWENLMQWDENVDNTIFSIWESDNSELGDVKNKKR